MAKLSDGDIITTINNEEIVLTDADGKQLRMEKSFLAEAVRQVMREASSERKGLMNPSFFNAMKTHSPDLSVNYVYDSEIKHGCLFIVKNETRTHDMAMALLFQD